MDALSNPKVIGGLCGVALVGVAVALLSAKPTTREDFWHYTLGRCASQLQASIDYDPVLFRRDMHVEKCAPASRFIGQCRFNYVEDGNRRTEVVRVDCRAPKMRGLSPEEKAFIGAVR